MNDPLVKLKIRPATNRDSDAAVAPSLMILGLMVLVYFSLSSTSVEGVENLGKLHRQSNGITVGTTMCTIAALLHVARQIKLK